MVAVETARLSHPRQIQTSVIGRIDVETATAGKLPGTQNFKGLCGWTIYLPESSTRETKRSVMEEEKIKEQDRL